MANVIKAKFKIGDKVRYGSPHDSYSTHFVVDRVTIEDHQGEYRYSGIILGVDGEKTDYRIYACSESHLDFPGNCGEIRSKENKVDTNEYLKKIKVLSRAIYTEVLSQAIAQDKGEAYCNSGVVDECIDAAVQFETSFNNFAENAKNLIEGDKNAEK